MDIFDLLHGLFPFVGVGFILGCFPLAAGLGVQTLINMMKRF